MHKLNWDIFHTSTSKNENNYFASDFIIDGYVLKEYIGCNEIILIPAGVRVIEGGCFSNNHFIKKITIPSTVEHIGKINDDTGAFEFCEKLEEVFFEENSKLKSIEKFSFYHCVLLNKITNIPLNLNNIKSHAFTNCRLDNSTIKALIKHTNKDGLADDWNN